MRRPLVSVAAIVLISTTLNAADWSAVEGVGLGTQVRIKTSGRKTISGAIQSTAAESLVVTSGAPVTVKRSDVVSVAVRKKGHRGRNVLIGLGVGAGAGATAGAIPNPGSGFCILYCTRGQSAGLAALVGGIIGTVFGVAWPTGGWKEVYRQ